MKLYAIPGACSLAPHIVLRELDIPFEFVTVDRETKMASDGENYLEIHPLGYVGALKLANGEVLTETSVMLEYLADLKPEAGLVPSDGTWERIRLRECLSFVACELNCAITPLFRNLPTEARALICERLFKRLDLLDSRLSRQDFISGEDCYSIADAYLFTVLLWPPRVGIDLAAWPALVGYSERIRQRGAVVASLAAEGI